MGVAMRRIRVIAIYSNIFLLVIISFFHLINGQQDGDYWDSEIEIPPGEQWRGPLNDPFSSSQFENGDQLHFKVTIDRQGLLTFKIYNANTSECLLLFENKTLIEFDWKIPTEGVYHWVANNTGSGFGTFHIVIKRIQKPDNNWYSDNIFLLIIILPISIILLLSGILIYYFYIKPSKKTTEKEKSNIIYLKEQQTFTQNEHELKHESNNKLK